MISLKPLDYKILCELMKNSKMSHKQLARTLGTPQRILTRRIAKLEKEGLVEYTVIPNLGKLDVEIMAFSFNKWTNEAFAKVLPKKDFADKVQNFLSTHPNVIFATTGGSGLEKMDSVFVSIHKDYADYDRFVREVEKVWGKYVDKFDSFIVSLKSNCVARQITFKALAEYFDQV